MPHANDIESIVAVLGFLGTVAAAWLRATKWCVKFVSMHEDINEEVRRIRTDLAVLVDQMHELAIVVRQTEKDTERLETRFDRANGKYTKN